MTKNLVKLGDICNIQSGGTPSRQKQEYWNNGTISWVKISDFSGKYLNHSEEKITEKGLENSSAKIFPKGTVLYSIFATLGEVTILEIDAATNQAIAGLSIKKDSILKEYLYYVLLSLKKYVIFLGRGVAQNNINISILRELKIPIFSIDQQQKIVAILDQVNHLISLRSQQLEQLDLLIKSRFVEMFGDTKKNIQNYPIKQLVEVSDIVSGITKGRKTKNKELFEVPYMAVSNVKDGYIDWTKVKTILATQEEIDKYRLLPNDILMTEGGDPDKVGRGSVIEKPLKDCIHQNHIFRVRLNTNLVLPSFFAEFLKQPVTKMYFLSCAKQTTGIASINMKQLSAMLVLLPPIELQTQFAAFVEEVERTKATVKQSLEWLNTLKAKLMQDYFG